MKTLWMLWLALAVLPGIARAQLTIDWSSVDGGGGTSSGGSYTLSGTIGQADAGTMTGGTFTLEGGFWPALTVSTTPGEPPTLVIQWSGANLQISWAPATPGFVLEQTDALGSGVWTTAPAGAPPVTVPASAATRFFRLHHTP